MIAQLAAAALILSSTAASAQDWTGRVTLYGWLPAA